MNILVPTKREYRQSARAKASEATGERILDAFSACLHKIWFDEIRLEDVAGASDVTVQTVIRRFGGKEGLLEAVHERLANEIRRRREVPPGDVSGAISALITDYEELGDLVMRLLAQEERYPPIKAMTDVGRAMHREWMTTAFQPWLDKMSKEQRCRAVDGLVVAGDIYVWKLIRKDLRRPIADYRALVEKMSAAAVGASQEEVLKNAVLGVAQ